jgi:hypothetical protein
MYITPHLHEVKDFWKFEIMFNRFLILKFLISQLSNCECFLSVDNIISIFFSSRFFYKDSF